MRSLVYIVIIFVTAACSSSGKFVRTFDEAELLLKKDPAEAFERLNAIDVSALEDSASMARWALLYSEAMAANNLAAPTDTIVNAAIDYYSRHNMRAELERAMQAKRIALESASPTGSALFKALFLQKEKEYFLFKARAERERIIYLCVIAILAASSVIAWQRRRLHDMDRENAMLISEAADLKSAISLRDEDCTHFKERLARLLDKRFALIDSLCETYYETQGTRAEKNSIVTRVKDEIEAVKADESIFADMEKTVNDCRSNLLVRLRTAWPDIRPDDYRLTVYLACHLSPRTISLLLGEKIEVVYKRKSRLKSRLSAKTHEIWDEI